MAYKPISQTTQTGGYVPIGQKTNKAKAEEAFSSAFPATNMVAKVSQPTTTVKQKTITERNKELEELTGQPAPFESTKTGIAVNTITGLPKASLDVLQDIGQGSLRAYAAVSSLIPGKTLTPSTNFQKELYGTDKPITFSSVGRELTGENTPAYIAAPVGFVLGVSDLFGGGKSLKGFQALDDAIRSVKAAKTVEESRSVLRTAGLTDEFIDSLKLDTKVLSANSDDAAKAVINEIRSTVSDIKKVSNELKIKETQIKSPTKVVKTEKFTPKIQTSKNIEENLIKSQDPIADLARSLNIDDVQIQDTLNKLQQWISGGTRRVLDVPTLRVLDNINIKPKKEITLYREGPVDNTQFQSWSVNKPTNLEGVTVQTFKPEEILIDTTSPVLKTLYRDDIQAQEVLSQFNKIEGEIITKPTSMVGAGVSELPPLPKLAPEVASGLRSQQANTTITQAIRDRYANAVSRTPKGDNALAQAAKKPGNTEGFMKLAGEILTPISSRLGRINPELKTTLRKFEFNVAKQTTEDSEKILPLLKATKKMSKVDRQLFDLARKNGDSEVIDALADKYGIQDELNKAREVLDGIFQRAQSVGMDIQYRGDYFPRMVTNPEKFMGYLRGRDDWGQVNRAIEDYASRKGLKYTDLTEEEKSSIVNNLLRGYGSKIVLGAPSPTKQRTIEVLDTALNEFYESTDSALSTYIIRMNDEIEGRRFFGKELKPSEDIGDAKIQDSIGSYVMKLVADGKIKPTQEKEVSDILKARFHRGKMNGALDAYRNAEYLSTMGSPISAITQIGDVAFSLYNNGFFNTLRGITKSVTKKGLTKEQLGIEQITQEFTKNSIPGKVLDRVFKLTGLNSMDKLGKETLVNGYLSKLQTLAKKNDSVLQSELDSLFDPAEALAVKDALMRGDYSNEGVRLMAFNKLLDFQPVAKSEMPQKYLEMPNGRIFYMLKSFTLKQYDVFRREAIDEIISGEPKRVAKGMKNLILLAGSFVAANATADEIKDFILGRETPMSDKVVDNMWRLVGASKYDVYRARTDGVARTLLGKLLFPTSIIDRGGKDIYNIVLGKEYENGPLKGERYKLESTQTIPIGGKLYYWWFGRGAQKEEYKSATSTDSTLPQLPKLPQQQIGGGLPTLPKIGTSQ